MKKFLARNIDGRGRWLRGVFGAVLILTGLLISAPGRWICFALVVAGGFALFEAERTAS